MSIVYSAVIFDSHMKLYSCWYWYLFLLWNYWCCLSKHILSIARNAQVAVHKSLLVWDLVFSCCKLLTVPKPRILSAANTEKLKTVTWWFLLFRFLVLKISCRAHSKQESVFILWQKCYSFSDITTVNMHQNLKPGFLLQLRLLSDLSW